MVHAGCANPYSKVHIFNYYDIFLYFTINFTAFTNVRWSAEARQLQMQDLARSSLGLLWVNVAAVPVVAAVATVATAVAARRRSSLVSAHELAKLPGRYLAAFTPDCV